MSGGCPQPASRVSIPIVREKPSRELLVEGGKHAKAERSGMSIADRAWLYACLLALEGGCLYPGFSLST